MDAGIHTVCAHHGHCQKRPLKFAEHAPKQAAPDEWHHKEGSEPLKSIRGEQLAYKRMAPILVLCSTSPNEMSNAGHAARPFGIAPYT